VDGPCNTDARVGLHTQTGLKYCKFAYMYY
jgi:hypothetical protein